MQAHHRGCGIIAAAFDAKNCQPFTHVAPIAPHPFGR
jgi:hypothetical protein